MTVRVLTNALVYGHGYDFTGDANELSLAMSQVSLDKSNYRSGAWREFTGGAKSHELTVAGHWSVSDPAPSQDEQSFSDLGTANRVFTVGSLETADEPTYMFRSSKQSYEALKGSWGELAGFSLRAVGTDGVGVIRGQLAKAKGTVSATGALGSGLQLGAVGATQFLYATFHIFTAATTITVVLESDDNSGFTTATTRQTIGPLSAAGGTWVTRTAGAITDDYFRFRVTGITGTFTVAGSIGVGS